MSKYTINEVAEQLNIDYPTASGLVKLMVSKGAGKEVGKKPQAGGRGKPSTIYELDLSFTITLQPKADPVAVVTEVVTAALASVPSAPVEVVQEVEQQGTFELPNTLTVEEATAAFAAA